MVKPSISFEVFSQLDLRVGTIITVEKVEGSEKLLKLEVDLGEEIGKRQILSGVCKFYLPEELLNKQVVVVCNLEPKTMAGLESQGMVLMADFEKPILLIPAEKVNAGTNIR